MTQRNILGLVLCSTLFVACQSTKTDHLAVDAPNAQLFEGMGSHKRSITTTSTEAQLYFDQGLAWMFSFNHDEAIKSFARAAQLDPEAAMPWWGIALCEGPNYNDPMMTEERSAGAWGALQQALARMDDESPLEQELINALSARYARREPEDRSHLEQAYADAMACVWEAHPADADVGTLYAEALMIQRPWKLYDTDRKPTGDTPKIVMTLESVLALDENHPGANHLYIHAIEPSEDPSRALGAADRLCTQIPSAGHMNHMPSHIYVQTGDWEKSIAQNIDAMRADDVYRELSPEQMVQHMYMTHNAHMLAFSAMMVGREKEAMGAARAMWEGIPAELLPMAGGFVDLWFTSIYDVQKRFGRWDDLLAEPAPPEFLPITTAVWHAHRAIAFAAKKDFDNARTEHELFLEAKAAIPEDSVFSEESTHKILEVSVHFVPAEIALQKGHWDAAIAHLAEAIKVEDTLGYGEPPLWLQPTRHTLGAVYLKAGRFEEAERTYREDLDKWRENGWSLFGLSRALAGQGRAEEAAAVRARYDAVWAKADEATDTSCKCLPGT